MKLRRDRRKFLISSAKAGLLLPFFGNPLLSCKNDPSNKKSAAPNKKLHILILGGTSFLGPHQIAYALNRGHSITTFTRGKTKPTIHKELFDKVEQLIGDRANNLNALHDRKWDAVIDNSGHRKDWTRDTAKLLRKNVDQYLYTSSTGVYYPYLDVDIKEDTHVLLKQPEGITDEEMKMEYGYGVMKSNSELAAKEHFGENRTIIVRPTYMVGPGDKTDRFIHWPVRLAREGEVLVPGKKEDPVQFIDVRDVAQWMIRLLENKTSGTFNAVGPKSPMVMYDFVKEAHSAFDSQISLVPIDDYDFLMEHQIKDLVPWIMPTGNNFGSARVNNKKGIANGLAFTDLKKTILDTHTWWYSDALTNERRQKFETDPRCMPGREKRMLDDWKQLQSNLSATGR